MAAPNDAPGPPTEAIVAVVAIRELFSGLAYDELRAATVSFDRRPCAHGGRLLGQGTDGEVYYAYNLRGMEVAVKRMRPHVGADDVVHAALRALDVEHDNVLPVWGVVHDAHSTCLVMPLMECSLYEALEDSTQLPAHQRVVVARDIAAGLVALHGHQPDVIVHCNLKPGTVLLHHPNGKGWRARIASLARSFVLPEGSEHVLTNVTGTLGFICPEYYATGKVRPSCDVYSLGVILLLLLTGMSWKDMFQDLVEQEHVHDRRGRRMPFCTIRPSLRDALQRGADAVPSVQMLARERGVKWSALACAELLRLSAACLQLAGRDRPLARDVCAALEALLALGEPAIEDNAASATTEEAAGADEPIGEGHVHPAPEAANLAVVDAYTLFGSLRCRTRSCVQQLATSYPELVRTAGGCWTGAATPTCFVPTTCAA